MDFEKCFNFTNAVNNNKYFEQFYEKKTEIANVYCHARKREKLSYLLIPKTTSMCYMYEITIVF